MMQVFNNPSWPMGGPPFFIEEAQTALHRHYCVRCGSGWRCVGRACPRAFCVECTDIINSRPEFD